MKQFLSGTLRIQWIIPNGTTGPMGMGLNNPTTQLDGSEHSEKCSDDLQMIWPALYGVIRAWILRAIAKQNGRSHEMAHVGRVQLHLAVLHDLQLWLNSASGALATLPSPSYAYLQGGSVVSG